MKAFVIGIGLLVLIGVGGYYGMRIYSKTQTRVDSYRTDAITKTGTIQPGKGDDYSYILVSTEGSTGVASQQIDLGLYVGKKVTVSGQDSGTTLYVDTVTEN